MTVFTEEQKRAIESIASNRLTVVRAGPGSGKTRVFVQALTTALQSWNDSRRGIAALSFTNTAHELVSERLGGPPGPPHFIDTLDAFFLRFVVRPFGHLVGLPSTGSSLLAAPLDTIMKQPQVTYRRKSGKVAPGIDSVFSISLTGGTEKNPELRHAKSRYVLVAPEKHWVWDAKIKQWRKRGWITHSDAQYFASKILVSDHGNDIVDLISRRFGMILVDEYQDTGWFLSRALGVLLSSPKFRCAVVGDPDQAIFHFGGSHSRLFEETETISDAKQVALAQSHRCPPKIAAVASMLSRSGKSIASLRTDLPGHVGLIIHDYKAGDALDIGPVIERVRLQVGTEAPIAIVTRNRKNVRRLSRSGDTEIPWKETAGSRLARAASALREGDPRTAASIVRRQLHTLLQNDNDVLEDDDPPNIDITEWQHACREVLMCAAEEREGETWSDWLLRQKECVTTVIERIAPSHPRKFGAKFRKSTDADLQRSISTPGRDGESVMTVHAAKGREFEHVLFYIPPLSGSNCPSEAWWSDAPDSEEREIAFVACSRAKASLHLAIHKNTYKQLQANRPEFVALFGGNVINLCKPKPE